MFLFRFCLDCVLCGIAKGMTSDVPIDRYGYRDDFAIPRFVGGYVSISGGDRCCCRAVVVVVFCLNFTRQTTGTFVIMLDPEHKHAPYSTFSPTAAGAFYLYGVPIAYYYIVQQNCFRHLVETTTIQQRVDQHTNDKRISHPVCLLSVLLQHMR